MGDVRTYLDGKWKVVCVCRTVFFTGTWKIVCCLCTLAHRGERIKRPPCLLIFKKKATLYICPSGVLLARNAITEMVSGFPLPSLKKIFLIMEVFWIGEMTGMTLR